MNFKLRILVAALAFSGLVSCSSVYRNHGYTPSKEDLAGIVSGVDTRFSVEETLGEPTIEGVGADRAIYYISSRWQHFTWRAPKPVERQIVAVSFDENSVVRNVARYGLADGQVVILNTRVSDGGAGRIPFIRQLMANLSRFNA